MSRGHVARARVEPATRNDMFFEYLTKFFCFRDWRNLSAYTVTFLLHTLEKYMIHVRLSQEFSPVIAIL